MRIILIAAMAANRVIGRGAEIPWHIPGEQQRFKEITLGHTLIMGRKTFESIGRPLPDRRNIVISRRKDYQAPGCLVAASLAEALRLAADAGQVFIVGGGQVYREALPLADEIQLTTLARPVAGDVFFPAIPETEFALIHQEQAPGPESYTISIYRRISPPPQGHPP